MVSESPSDAQLEQRFRQICRRCREKGLRITSQRRAIIRAILISQGKHPDAEALRRQAQSFDARTSLASVYRTLRLLRSEGILSSHDFGGLRARYEENSGRHHDHLIDVESGQVIEFQNSTIESLQKKVAAELGYELVDHRLELYGRRMR